MTTIRTQYSIKVRNSTTWLDNQKVPPKLPVAIIFVLSVLLNCCYSFVVVFCLCRQL